MTSYSLVQRALHWLVALSLAALYLLGLWMTTRAGANLWDDQTNLLYGLHKALGATVLLMMVLRVFFKLRTPAPGYPASVAPATGTHRSDQTSSQFLRRRNPRSLGRGERQGAFACAI